MGQIQTWRQRAVQLVVCCVPLASWVRSLTTRGKPVERREGDASLFALEKTSTLGHDRHPMRWSDVLGLVAVGANA